MGRRLLVLAIAAIELVTFSSLLVWNIAVWKEIGWSGIAFNAEIDADAEAFITATPFGEGSRHITVVTPRSPAARAGVTDNEKVIAVNGIPVGDLADLRELHQSALTGDILTYNLEGETGSRRVALVLESPFRSPFVIARMSSSVIVGIVWLLISLLVYWSHPQSRTATVFFFLCSTGAIIYFLLASGELLIPDARGILPTHAELWPLLYIGVLGLLTIAMANLLLHLSLVFPKPRPVVDRWPEVFRWIHTAPFLVFVSLAAILLIVPRTKSVGGLLVFETIFAILATATLLRFSRKARKNGWLTTIAAQPLTFQFLVVIVMCQFGLAFQILPDAVVTMASILLGLTAGFSLFGWLTVFSILTCVSLFRSYRESGVEIKRQVRWPLWGTLTAVSAWVFITFFSIGMGYLSEQLGISNYTITTVSNSITKAVFLLIPISFGFSIFKHRLMDIDVIIRKTVIYSGVTGVVLALYLVLAGISGVIFVRATGFEGEAAAVVTTLAVVALFVPIRNRVQEFVDNRFFQRERSLEAAQARISSRVLGETGDELLPALADEIQQGILCRSVALFVLTPDGHELRIEASVGLSEKRASEFSVARTSPIFDSGDQVFDLAKTELQGNTKNALRRAGSDTVAVARRGNDLLGLIAIGSRLDGQQFDDEDTAFLAAAADQLSLAIGRSRQHRAEAELGQAREIQRALLPTVVPKIEGIEVSARWQPAREVSGDYYDVIAIDEHRLALCIGDVVGKGMPAALLMSSLQAALRAVSSNETSPKQVCSQVRNVMLGNLKGGTFVTFFIAVLDRRHNELRYTNAGHNPPLLVRHNGTIEQLITGGPVFARLFAEKGYEEGVTSISPGDRLVLFTDGVTEAMDAHQEMFGDARLEELVRDQRASSASEIDQSITDTVLAHADGRLQDDLTLVVASVVSYQK